MLRVKQAVRLPVLLQRALGMALQHDCLNLSQSAAYSALVALFPALVVIAALIALLPDVAPLKQQVAAFAEQVLPANVLPMLQGYFASKAASSHTTRALLLAGIVSLLGASSVIATLMEGLRRAEGLPSDCWTFLQRRVRALALVPLSLAPFVVATLLVVFGRYLTEWLADHLLVSIRPTFFALALLVRWTVSLAGVVGLTALIYHMGTPPAPGSPGKRGWARTVPGAMMATGMWFVLTLLFGWYVTRANYSLVYGSLGTGIALLFWLYFVFLSVLCGAEFNVQFCRQFLDGEPPAPIPVHTADSPNAIG